MKKIKAYCLGEKIKLDKVEKNLIDCPLIKFKDFLLIDKKIEKIFIFPYGVLISWNSTFDNNKEIIEKIKKYIINPHKILQEEYFFQEDKTFKIINDTFFIPNNEKVIIAISYALSQSLKLNYFEDEIEKEINKTKNIPIEIQKYWTSKLSQKKY